MAAAEIDKEVTTKLLALLNASATKVRKRKRDFVVRLSRSAMGGKRVVVPNVEEKPKESGQEPMGAGKEDPTISVSDERKQKVRPAFVLR